VSARVETRALTASPRFTPTVAGMPMRSAVCHSTLPSAPWAIVPTVAVKMIAANDVAVATLASYASRPISSGTMITPPPTPKSAANSPAARPMTASRARRAGSPRAASAGPEPLLGSVAVTAPDRRLADLLAPLRERPGEAAVLCDVDGTLAPIVARPEDARLLDGSRDVLAALRDRVRLLGFVSGRGLADVERLVGLDGCAYAGNHGMELHLPGERPRLADGVAEHVPTIATLAAMWPRERLATGDLRLEEKGATLSVHARGARDPEAAGLLMAEVAREALEHGLVTTTGRQVLEVRPPVRVDKGTAATTLLRDAGARAALYVGDDRTDADAWRALRELRDAGALDHAVALAVASAEVPPEVRAAADAEVDGPAGALAALRLLAH
jgi:trehalose 6-phosphate phosphatase